MYKLIKDNISQKINSVYRIQDNTCIPFNENNSDYQTYLKWLDGYEWQMVEPMKMEWVKVAESNTPLPADEE